MTTRSANLPSFFQSKKAAGLIFVFLLTGIFHFGCVSTPKVSPAPLIPVRDFFKNPDITAFTLSPDG